MTERYYRTTKAFDYLNANEVYRVYAIDRLHARFWNDEKDCGTFISNWKVEQAINDGTLVEIK